MELVSASPPSDLGLPTCKHCKRPFTPRHDRGRPQLHCSDECRLAYRKESGSEAMAAWKYRHSDAGRESRHRSKRRKNIEAPAELKDRSFDRLAIFARDAWRCQLCCVKVQDKRPEAMDSATIRLRLPLAAGGRYSFGNCETTCRQCNGRSAALVAMSIADPSFPLPRSLRFDGIDPSAYQGPPAPLQQSFGSDPATSETENPTLVPVSL